MKYMLIDTTVVETTRVIAVATLSRVQLLGRLAQADGKTVIAPPVQGRGFTKLTKLPLQYLFWNTCQEAPPEDYGVLVQKCLDVIDQMPEDQTPIEALEAEVARRCPQVPPEDGKPPVEGEPVTRPRTAGATGKVWDIAEQVFSKTNTIDRKAIIEACEAAGINAATAATQFAKWKKTKGI